jgi:hypothetical protein
MMTTTGEHGAKRQRSFDLSELSSLRLRRSHPGALRVVRSGLLLRVAPRNDGSARLFDHIEPSFPQKAL